MEQLRQRKNAIVQIARKHGAGNVWVFGSVARGEDSDKSDIDLLVDLVIKPSSWFPSGMALELQDLLGTHVDVLTERALHPLLRDKVVRESVKADHTDMGKYQQLLLTILRGTADANIGFNDLCQLASKSC